MITIQREIFNDTIMEMMPLCTDHFLELKHSGNTLDFDFFHYLMLENLDKLVLVTVRDEGLLIGYFMGAVNCSPHCKQDLHFVTDSIFIVREYRKGFLGLRLLKFVEEVIKQYNVKEWFISSSDEIIDITPLFKRLKFSKVETTYSKILG